MVFLPRWYDVDHVDLADCPAGVELVCFVIVMMIRICIDLTLWILMDEFFIIYDDFIYYVFSVMLMATRICLFRLIESRLPFCGFSLNILNTTSFSWGFNPALIRFSVRGSYTFILCLLAQRYYNYGYGRSYDARNLYEHGRSISDNLVTCGSHTCGVGAHCIQGSVRPVCACLAGHSGDPLSQCIRIECVGEYFVSIHLRLSFCVLPSICLLIVSLFYFFR